MIQITGIPRLNPYRRQSPLADFTICPRCKQTYQPRIRLALCPHPIISPQHLFPVCTQLATVQQASESDVTEMTPKRARKGPMFIKELRANGGFVSKACETVIISRQTAYRWRAEDPSFAAEWDRAVELATEDLEEEARRRAFEGFDEPVFYQGEVCGHIRKYSDSLLMFAIKARKPEYRDRITVDVKQLDSDIERELAILAARSQASIAGEVEGEEPIN